MFKIHVDDKNAISELASFLGYAKDSELFLGLSKSKWRAEVEKAYGHDTNVIYSIAVCPGDISIARASMVWSLINAALACEVRPGWITVGVE